VNLEGALTWAFEFEDQPYFAGQRVLATNGIDLPVLNVFRMFSHMSGQRLSTQSSAEIPVDAMMRDGVRGAADVAALASLDGNKLCVMIWHYHDDDVSGPDAHVELALNNLPKLATTAKLTRFEIDDSHSNAYAEWKRLGSPGAPNETQYEQMKKASALATVADTPNSLAVANRSVSISINLPRQAVTLLVLEYAAPDHQAP
jgi:xylan 1,4-beta-xylosidase